MKMSQCLPKLPEAFLTLFGLFAFGWFGFRNLSLLLFIPFVVGVLAGVHLIAPKGRTTQVGLGLAYVGGGLIAGFLLLGFMIPGGAPEEYDAWARGATPLLTLYAVSLISLIVKLPWIPWNSD